MSKDGACKLWLTTRSLLITPNSINDSYGWHLQYLTNIGLAVSTLSFFFDLLSDLTLSPTLFALQNVLCEVASPLSPLVSSLYYSLRTIDSRLIILEWSPNPRVLTYLSFHPFPTVLLMLDHLFFSPPGKLKHCLVLHCPQLLQERIGCGLRSASSRKGFILIRCFGMLGLRAGSYCSPVRRLYCLRLRGDSKGCV